MPRPLNLERRHDRAIENLVAIDFPARGKSGVESRRRQNATHNANFLRQGRVQRAAPALGCQATPGYVYVSALRKRMHAGVSAAGAVHAQRLAGDFGERRFQPILDRVATFLTLPAAKWRPIIGDNKL